MPSAKQLAALGLLALLAALMAWSFLSGGVLGLLFDQHLSAAEKLAALQAYFDAWGPLAPLAYLGLVVIEVIVAPLPGTMLYAPGGLLFGGFLGGTLALLGNVIGAGGACWLMRTLGQARFASWFPPQALARVQQALSERGFWVIFLLRLNPLTSSDLVSYAAGLTPVSLLAVMGGTLLGMAPLCYAQSYLSQELFHWFPALLYPLLGLCAIYTVAACYVLWRLGRGASEPLESGSSSSS